MNYKVGFRMWSSTFFFSLSVALLASPSVHADVLVEYAGGESSFTPTNGWVVGKGGWPSQSAAMPFTLPHQSYVSGVEMALTAVADWAANNYSVSILGSSNGLPDTSVIWVDENPPEPLPLNVRLLGHEYDLTVVTFDPVLLEADTKYWLYMSCTGRCEFDWWVHPSNPWGQGAYLGPDLRWEITGLPTAMFRIQGTAAVVPEPSSFTMILAGLCLLVFASRQRHFSA
jgi:hypothetical protein